MKDNFFSKIKMKLSIGRLILTVLMLFIVVVGGTFAWLTYRSSQSALVLTIGDINRTQVTLTPYEIQTNMIPGTSYSSGVYSDVTVSNQRTEDTTMTLFYKFNDNNTYDGDLNYMIVSSSTAGSFNPENSSNVVERGTIKPSTMDDGEVVLSTNIAGGTSNLYYRVYLWADGTEDTTSAQGTSTSVELNGAIGSVQISGTNTYGETLTANVTDSSSSSTYKYQWYYKTSATGTPVKINGATSKTYKIQSGLVGTYIYVEATASGDYSEAIVYTDTADVAVSPASPTLTLSGTTSFTYTGRAIEAVVEAISSGTPSYTYYTDSCSTKTTTSTGASASGKAPIDVGNYYVKAVIAPGMDTSTTPVRTGSDVQNDFTQLNSDCTQHNITAKSITVSWTANSSDDYIYDGGAHNWVANATVQTAWADAPSDGKTAYGESMSFTVTGSNNINAGTSAKSSATCAAVSGGRGKCSNYTLTNTTKTFTISKKSVPVTWGSTTTFTYNGTAQAPTASVTTGVTGETMAVTRTSQKDAGTSLTSTASCSGVTGGQAKCDNYTLTSNTKTYTINPKEVSVVWTNTSLTYNGSNQLPTASVTTGVSSETMTMSVTSTSTEYKNVGTYTANATCSKVTGGQAKCANYTLKSGTTSTSYSITAKAVTINATAASKTYDGTALTSNACSGSLVSGHTVTCTNTGTITNKGSTTNTVTTVVIKDASGNDVTSNYTVTKGTGTLTINAKSVAVTWGSTTTFTYNGSAQAPTASVTTGVTGETMTVTRTSQKDAGTSLTSTASCSSVSGGQAKCDNYTLTSNTKTYTINKKSVTVTWGSTTTFTYNGSAQAPTASVSSTGVTGETMTVTRTSQKDAGTSLTSTASCSSVSGGQAKCDNYTLTSNTKTYTINPKSIAVAWGSTTTFTYNGSGQAPTASVTTGVSGETMTVTRTTSKDASSSEYTSTASCSKVTGGQAKCANYTLTSTTKNYTINPKEVSVTWTNTSLTYNGSNRLPTASVTTGVSSETMTMSVTSTSTEYKNVGTYTANATCSKVTGGQAKCANYTLKSGTTSTSYSITAKAVTINATAASKTYDGTALTSNACSGSLVSGHTVTCTNTGTITNKGSATNTVTTVVIKDASGNDVTSNYTVTKGTGTLTINAKSVAVTWGSTTTFTYNGSAQAPTASVSSTGVTGETMTITRTSQKDAGTSLTSTASCSSVSGGQAKCDNYTLTSNTKTYTINKKSVTVTWGSTTTFTYNGSTQAPTASVSSTGVTGETMTVTRTSQKDAGTSLTSTASCSSVSGGQAKCDNYTLTSNTKTYTINPKSIAVAWGSTTTFTYNGSGQAPTASVTTGVSGETMTVTRTTSKDASSSEYTSTASCSKVTGGQAKCANYTLTSTTKKYTINPKEVSVTWTNTSLTYNGSNRLPTASVTTGVSSETMTMSVTSTSTEYKNVGTYTANATCSKVTGGQAKCANYTLKSGTTSTSYSITAKAVTINATAASKTYDGTALTSNACSGSLVSGHTVTCTNTGTITNKGSATNTVTTVVIKDASGNDVTSNYTVTKGTGTLTINAKSVAVTWGSTTTFTYNGSAQAPTASVSSTGVTGETMTVTRTSQKDAGTSLTSTASCSSVSGGQAKCDNYTLTSNTKTYTINKKSVTVTWGSTTTFTYNGSAQAPTASVSSTGVTGETMTVTRTSQKDAGTSLTSTASCSSVSGGQAKCANYTLTSNTKTYTINPKSVAVTWGSTTTFTYNGSGQAPTASVTTGVSSETMTVTRTTATDAGTHTSTASCSKVTGGQAKCANYTLTSTTKEFTINKANCTCSISSTPTLEYPSNTSSVTGSTTGTLFYACVYDNSSLGGVSINVPGTRTITASSTYITASNITESTATLTAKNYITAGTNVSVSQAAGTNNNACTAASTTVKINPSKYTISFDENGGYDGTAPSSITKTYGSSVSIPATFPRRYGYTFKGWATTADATSAAYYANGDFRDAITANTTLYAVWEQKSPSPLMAVTSAQTETSNFLRSTLKRNQIASITFVAGISEATGTVVDVSQNSDNSVKMWYGSAKADGTYDVYIGSATDFTSFTSGYYLFSQLTKLTSISFMDSTYNEVLIDTSSVTDMSHMFQGNFIITTLDLSSFNTSNVTNMSSMFSACYALTSLTISSFDTSKVTDMSSMFDLCNSLTSLDVSGFDTTNVTNMNGMFNGCKMVTSLDVDGFDTSKVTDMGSMFGGCESLTSIDVSGFDTSKVTNMASMFQACSGLTSLSITNFDTAKVTDMSNMFEDCSGLTGIDLSSFNTGAVTDMSSMFFGCTGMLSLDLTGFDTADVTMMDYMFRDCEMLSSLDLTSFDMTKVTRMNYMFDGCNRLESITFGSNFKFVEYDGLNGHLPEPSSDYITYANGKWYKSSDNWKEYTPAGIAALTGSNLAGTYVAYPYMITYYNGTTKLGSSSHGYDTNSLTSWDELNGTVSYATHGWEFYGWSTSQTSYSTIAGDAGTIDLTTGSTLNLYAVYKRTITFKSGLNSATTHSSTPTQYWNPYGSTNGTHLSGVTSPALTAISGFTALGFRNNTTAATKQYNASATIYPARNASNTLYGVYSRTVNFYSGVSKATDTEVTQYYNSANNYKLTTPSTITEIDGFTILGWRDDTTASTSETTKGSSSTSSASNFYAVYSRTVKFYSGPVISSAVINEDGLPVTSTISDVTQYYNSNGVYKTTTPALTDITGWTTLGWRDDTTISGSEFGAAIDITSSASAFFAVYSRTITFYSGVSKASSSTKTQYLNVGESYGHGDYDMPTTAAAITTDYNYNYTGYDWEWIGWTSDDENVSGVVYGHPSMFGDMPGPFYAVYKRKVSFEYYFGLDDTREEFDGLQTDFTQYYNSSGIASSLTAPASLTVSNWSLFEWRSNQLTHRGTDSDYPSYNAGATVNLAYDDLPVFYSTYRRAFKVSYNANGGTGTTASNSIYYAYHNGFVGTGSQVYSTGWTPTTNGFTRSGYTFNGWNTKADGSGISFGTGQQAVVLDVYTDLATNESNYLGNPLLTNDNYGMTLYAQWQ